RLIRSSAALAPSSASLSRLTLSSVTASAVPRFSISASRWSLVRLNSSKPCMKSKKRSSKAAAGAAALFSRPPVVWSVMVQSLLLQKGNGRLERPGEPSGLPGGAARRRDRAQRKRGSALRNPRRIQHRKRHDRDLPQIDLGKPPVAGPRLAARLHRAEADREPVHRAPLDQPAQCVGARHAAGQPAPDPEAEAVLGDRLPGADRLLGVVLEQHAHPFPPAPPEAFAERAGHDDVAAFIEPPEDARIAGEPPAFVDGNGQHQ